MAKHDAGIADGLERSAGRAQSLEDFGAGVVRQILAGASRELRGGKEPPLGVSLGFEVSIASAPALGSKVPEVDICWEICPAPGQSFLRCWAACEGPSFEVGPIHIRTCEDIARDWGEATTPIERFGYLIELIRRGCLKAETLQVIAERLGDISVQA